MAFSQFESVLNREDSDDSFAALGTVHCFAYIDGLAQRRRRLMQPRTLVQRPAVTISRCMTPVRSAFFSDGLSSSGLGHLVRHSKVHRDPYELGGIAKAKAA